MRLSFDLDGVIADTDNGMLGLLHRAAGEAHPGAKADLEQYYARARILLDPRDFLGSGDDFYIVSGRVPSAWGITHEWVARWFGLDAVARLSLVSTPAIEAFLLGGEDDQAYELLAERKLEVIRAIYSAVHFDNNPTIIAKLREAGVTAVMVGGGLR